MAYKGRYKLKHPEKYVGDGNKVVTEAEQIIRKKLRNSDG